ncbi:hypothetical protein PPACK8108_LOCUS22241 [Phakopsora pachyrhizi]|uniref:Uncharacterized protein n=1 Tax=Phakopsora pachyrhizi TaxID=170000 RepID=A0AAV0BLH2_PHAPC|nr:hypothetical protein PPACK8108_LOCUS22241 [Phakopsora pachyrhizi]
MSSETCILAALHKAAHLIIAVITVLCTYTTGPRTQGKIPAQELIGALVKH